MDEAVRERHAALSKGPHRTTWLASSRGTELDGNAFFVVWQPIVPIQVSYDLSPKQNMGEAEEAA